MTSALAGIRICDFTGQLAGAGATRILAAFGAQVIKIEDPVKQGRWDITRGAPPYVGGRAHLETGGGFNNHNVEKLGVTINLRDSRGVALLRRLVAVSDVVAENFAAGVLDRRGVTYEWMREVRPDVVYVSSCGFGQSGPYVDFKAWGPVVQAFSGLTYYSGRRDQPSAGWGFSYMDHVGAYAMALAILAGLVHHRRTGEGQRIDLATTEVAATLLGPVVLDHTVNGRRLRPGGQPDTNRSASPAMAPHGVYPCRGDDEWVAVACQDDDRWAVLAAEIGEAWATDGALRRLDGRLAQQDALDARVAGWTRAHDKFELARRLAGRGVAAAPVQRPAERIDGDQRSAAWGLWPVVAHPEAGEVRVDGLPVHLSDTDWQIERGAPMLGQHNDLVFGELLGMGADELAELRADGVV